jgi:hypothetical protein
MPPFVVVGNLKEYAANLTGFVRKFGWRHALFLLTEERMKAQLRIGMLAVVIIATLGVGFAQDDPDDSAQRVTGCVRKGPDANHYRLLDDNGKLWNLRSKNVSFAPHVGHLVTVSGTIPQKSNNDNDKAGDTSPQNDLVVTKLDMVRDTCTP